MAILDNCKTLLQISDSSKDSILNILIKESQDFAEAYTHTDDVGDSVIEQIVLYRYNLLGNEGLNSESYSGVSFNYEQDLPAYLLKELNPLRKVKFI